MTYILPPAWEQFYMENDPKERNVLLEAALQDETIDADEAAIVESFFRKRHPGKSNPKSEDRFLREFFHLMEVSQSRNSLGKKKIDILAANQLLKHFGLENAYKKDNADQDQLDQKNNFAYWEIRNATRRYIATTEGANYGRKLMGFIAPKRHEKQGMAVSDIWAIMNGVDQYLKSVAIPEIRDALTLVRDAVRDEYYEHDEDARARLDAYCSGHTI